jgi:hypothetical protein
MSASRSQINGLMAAAQPQGVSIRVHSFRHEAGRRRIPCFPGDARGDSGDILFGTLAGGADRLGGRSRRSRSEPAVAVAKNRHAVAPSPGPRRDDSMVSPTLLTRPGGALSGPLRPVGIIAGVTPRNGRNCTLSRVAKTELASRKGLALSPGERTWRETRVFRHVSGRAESPQERRVFEGLTRRGFSPYSPDGP